MDDLGYDTTLSLPSPIYTQTGRTYCHLNADVIKRDSVDFIFRLDDNRYGCTSRSPAFNFLVCMYIYDGQFISHVPSQNHNPDI